MKIVKQSYEILSPVVPLGLVEECKKIEKAGRLCYKSEDKITDDSWRKFITMLREKQHGAMLEHSSMTLKLITDRGVLAELTRHRIASFAVESTRYCNYSKDKFSNEITVIDPFIEECDDKVYKDWKELCEFSEKKYFDILSKGYTPQIARSVLPQSLKCEIIITANFREYLHIFTLRCSKAAHPSIRNLFLPVYKELNKIIPEIFTIKEIDDELIHK
jgi:thymidylate synthase (FAD)